MRDREDREGGTGRGPAEGTAGESPSSAAGPGGASASQPAADPSAKAAPSQQELAVRSALETVMDPEIG